MAPPKRGRNTGAGTNKSESEEEQSVQNSQASGSEEQPTQHKGPSKPTSDNAMPGESDTTFQFGQRFGATSQQSLPTNFNGYTPIAALDANTTVKEIRGRVYLKPPLRTFTTASGSSGEVFTVSISDGTPFGNLTRVFAFGKNSVDFQSASPAWKKVPLMSSYLLNFGRSLVTLPFFSYNFQFPPKVPVKPLPVSFNL